MRSGMLILLLAALAVPSPAAATTGIVSLRDHVGSAFHKSDRAHAVFELPGGFRQDYGALSGSLADGTYGRTARLPNGHECALRLYAGASVRQAPPAVRNGRVRADWRGSWLAITSRGSRGSARWYAGSVGDALYGVGVSPTPSWVRAGRPWTVYGLELTGSAPSGTPADRRSCAEVKRGLLPAVQRTIASMHLVRGPLPALRILPGVPAPAGAAPGTHVAQGPGGVRLLVPPPTVPCPANAKPELILGVQLPNPGARARVRMVRAKAIGPGGDVRGGPIWRTEPNRPGWHLDRLGLGACGRTVRWFYLVGLDDPRSTAPVRIDLTTTVLPAPSG